jgi:biotin operon repressor
VALRRLADRLEDAQVERALNEGWSWARIAEALGVTRQAVHKKHAKRLKGHLVLRGLGDDAGRA